MREPQFKYAVTNDRDGVAREPVSPNFTRKAETVKALNRAKLASCLWRRRPMGGWEILRRSSGRSVFVLGNNGEYYLQVPDNNRWGFYLTDGDQAWAGGFDSGAHNWVVIQAKNVPHKIRKILQGGERA